MKKQIISFFQDLDNKRFWLLLAMFIIPVSYVKLYDIDLWWHIQLGKSILAERGWPDFSTYYFTPVVRSVGDLRFTWLGDIALYLIYAAGGDFGLQLFRLIAVFLMCFFIYQTAGEKKNGHWQLIALMLLAVGTYEKQLVRNSLFALMFCPLMFYIWWQIRCHQRVRLIWLYPVLIALWGCIHGSYLLGFGLLVLILAGDAIDSLRGKSPVSKKVFVQYLFVIFLSFFLISVANPMTTSFYNLKMVKGFFPVSKSGSGEISSTEKEKMKNSIAGKITPNKTNIFLSIKNRLNNTLFKTENQAVVSSDFTSPFDNLERPAVWICLVIGLLTWVFLCFFVRPLRFSSLLPLFAVTVFGCGYLRLVGYIPIVSLAILFICTGHGEVRGVMKFQSLLAVKYAGIFVPALLLIAVYFDLSLGFPVPPSTQLHVFGTGRTPYYSEKCASILLQDSSTHNVFTTRNNGGFLLLRWFPRRKVFIDGFYAPHTAEVLNEYEELETQSVAPDFLVQKYGVDTAILDFNSDKLIDSFMKSKNWIPQYMDEGHIIFSFESKFSDVSQETEVLITGDEYSSLPFYYKMKFTKFFSTVSYYLTRKGKLKDALQFDEDYRGLWSQVKPFLDEASLEASKRMMANYEKAYGRVNDPSIRYEWDYAESVRQGRLEDALSYGLEVLEKIPDRYPVMLNLASIYSKMNDFENSEKMLEKVKTSEKDDPVYWSQKKKRVAEIYQALSRIKDKAEEPLAAYEFMKKAHDVDPDLVSMQSLYEYGIGISHDLTLDKKPRPSFNLLQLMEKDFSKSGRLMNEIAWHIISHPDQYFYNPENAKKYALDAVSFMKNDHDTKIDLAYDTAAEIFFVLKEYDRMLKYENLAIQTGPDERKKLYSHREIENNR